MKTKIFKTCLKPSFPGLSSLLRAAVLSAATVWLSCSAPAADKTAAEIPEPDYETACAWWPPHRNVWTPVGWKDHLFRFNVLYNGTVVARPRVEPGSGLEKWSGRDFKLTFTPSADSLPPGPRSGEPYQLSALPDRGLGNQGWTANPAPVLWTEWPLSGDGLVLRQEVFAHVPGGEEVVSGVEPLYAWIRLSVSRVDELEATGHCCFIIHLGSDNIRKTMEQEENLKIFPERSAYQVELTFGRFDAENGSGCRILEPDGRLRLAALSSGSARFAFRRGAPRAGGGSSSGRDCYLVVSLPASQGAYADLLLPMIPAGPEQAAAELALGRDGALSESDRFWSAVPGTAALVETPEEQLNRALAAGVKFAQVIAQKNPESGEYSFLSGSWHYERLWATPTSMTSHMLLDNLGYYAVVERHLELFRLNQGSVRPPGPSYGHHPGYFSTPAGLTSIDWLSDNGAVLYEVCRHALLTGDSRFIDRWLGAVIACCEFIKEARAAENHDGVKGVLPPAVATDRRVPNQSVWNIGWNYKGLAAAVRLLERVGHPRAGEFALEARDYREAFTGVLREAASAMPQWTDREGVPHPLVPLSLSAGGDIFHAFYLDTGPLFLVWAGLLDANDPLMRSSLAFFREGPNTRVFDPRGNCWQRPVLVHEISSCEPCYSWNLYHSWQLGDRRRFLEGMYSLLAGALSRQSYISCETRHGIYGNVFAVPLLADLVRLSTVDDQLVEGELHLLRLVPLAWLKSDFETRFENMPTGYGPVSVSFRLSGDRKALEVSCRAGFRHCPGKVLLHVPPLPGLEKVVINGRAVKASPGEMLTIEQASFGIER